MNEAECLCLPDKPVFRSEGEKKVWRSLRKKLRPQDVLLHGLHFSDGSGDSEIDIVIFAPDGARILDLKTDQVQGGSHELAALANVYGDQLRMYAAALEVTGVPVASASLLVARVPDGRGGCAVVNVPLARQGNS